MADLIELRARIDRVDAEILRLFLERMRISEDVSVYKRARGLPIYCPDREAAVLDGVCERAGAYGGYARELFSLLMDLSKRRQAALARAEGGALYGLIGRALSHSDSARIHARLGLKEYRLFELEPCEIASFLKTPGLGGLNVTIPYKREVLPFMNALTPEARAISCVNSIRFEEGGALGHNTDAHGFAYLARRAGADFAGKKVVIFGGGGGALAAAHASRGLGAREVVLVTRGGKDNYQNLSRHEDAQILVNATPVGMFPDEDGMACDPARFPKAEFALDLIYNPFRTDFLLRAGEAGIPCANGLAMLVAQAMAAEKFFLRGETGPLSPDDAPEIERVLAEMERNAASIALVGMPGAGKSAIGRALCALTGRECLDTDDMVARDAGVPPEFVIRRNGIARFREMERAAVARASLARGAVIVAGGGAVLSKENRARLRRNARVYHIQRALSLLDVQGRPLSEGANLEEMQTARAPFYKAARDAEIVNDRAVDDAARAIWADFCERARA